MLVAVGRLPVKYAPDLSSARIPLAVPGRTVGLAEAGATNYGGHGEGRS